MMVRSLVLFAHIFGMLVLFGVLGVEWLILGALRRSITHEQASPWLSLSAALPRATVISVGLILVSGIYLAVRAHLYDSGWVLVSFGAMVLMGILGGPVIRSRMRAIREAGGGDGTAATLNQHASDPLVRASLFIRVAVGLSIVYLMIANPGLVESMLLTGVAFTLGAAMSVGRRRARSSAVGG
jgi:uncharacterized membrane protein